MAPPTSAGGTVSAGGRRAQPRGAQGMRDARRYDPREVSALRPVRGLLAGVLTAITMVAAFAAVIVVARSGSEPTHFEQRGTDASLRVPLELGAPSVRLRERPTTAPTSA